MTIATAPEGRSFVGRRLETVDGKLRTRGTFRRLDVALRAVVAREFTGRTVTVTTRNGRTHDGDVVTVAGTTDGNVAHVLVVKERGYWPVAISLATIDSIEENR